MTRAAVVLAALVALLPVGAADDVDQTVEPSDRKLAEQFMADTVAGLGGLET